MSSKTSSKTVWASALGFCAGIVLALSILWVVGSKAGAGATPADPASAAPDAAAMGPPPATVRTAKAQVQTLRQRLAVTGRLQELRRATVAAEVEGKVLKVPVDEGDPVVGGQTVLAEIDGVWARQDLKRTEAQVAAAQATLDQAELDLAYLEQLLKAQSAKPKEVDDMRAQVAADRASLSAAIAERDRVQREVERLIVLAPFDGVVTRKSTEVGQWVAPGDAIVEVITRGDLDAVADVPEHMIDHVKLGDVAEVGIDPLGTTVRGEVVAINPNGANAARTFPVKVRLDDQGGRFKPGMSVTLWLPVGEEAPWLTVPSDAVMYASDSQSVWVGLPAEGSPMPTAMAVPVKPLFSDRGRVVVKPLGDDGPQLLADGSTVVIEGAERLFPGQPLMDVDQPPAMDGPPAGEAKSPDDASSHSATPEMGDSPPTQG